MLRHGFSPLVPQSASTVVCTPVAGERPHDVLEEVVCDMGKHDGVRTQTRPAIEFVSGEEGLRPKSYIFVYSFLEYVFTVSLKYEEAPGPHCGAEGKWR